MCGPGFYRVLPYCYALISIFELLSAIILIVALSGKWYLFNETSLAGTTTLSLVTTTTATLSRDTLAKRGGAFAIAFVGSIVPIFTGIVLSISSCCCCICIVKKEWRRPFLRFVAFNCNYPCYIPRPKLRFTTRIGFHTFFIILRIVAVIMYALLLRDNMTSSDRSVVRGLLLITAISLIFPILTIILDLYHYRIWWAYEPDIQIPSEDLAKPYSKKHKRFIPYPLIERYRTETVGNRKCKYGDACEGRELEHVVIFHSSDYKPQPRWSEEHPVYIGFHRTTPASAIKIAKSEFRGSAKGMLGPGAYFARSIDATSGKIGHADQTGAWFVAKISMKKVYTVEEDTIRTYSNNNKYDSDKHRFVTQGEWAKEYDTCYFNHKNDSKDEFCIKDPAKQILKWVVVIEEPHDRKVAAYGLDKELDAGPGGCC